MPVREALWQLESEKIVVIEVNKRIRVNTLTFNEMEEALQLLLMLEVRAAKKSCDLITEGDLSMLNRLLKKMEASLGSAERYLELNRHFHLTIYAGADSPMLLHLINSIWVRVNPYKHIIIAKIGDASTSLTCHKNLYEALLTRDKKELTKWLQRDLKLAHDLILPNFNHFFEQSGGNDK